MLEKEKPGATHQPETPSEEPHPQRNRADASVSSQSFNQSKNQLELRLRFSSVAIIVNPIRSTSASSAIKSELVLIEREALIPKD
ncbi:hypothetical protein HN51_016914 [Arachis hypogaea]